jgi:hypothetical protein
MPIKGSGDVLVVDEVPDQLGSSNILRRVRPEGSNVWIIEPPDGRAQDAWVAIRIEGDEVIGHSWSCYQVAIDLMTGAERTRKFTK